MSIDKIDSIINFPKPKDLTSLRGILSFENFFRGFVPYQSTIVAPLHSMVEHSAKKRSSVTWTPEGTKFFAKYHSAYS